MAALSLTCPTCGTAFPVPAEVVSVDEKNQRVLLRCDRSELYGHLRECAGAAGEKAGKALMAAVSDADLRGRIAGVLRIVEEAGHLTRGTRACTMCGATNEACLASLSRGRSMFGRTRKPGTPCCAACGVGNTHPTAEERTPCAVWATEHGSKD